MTVADRRLDDVLAPLRDLHLADLLETIAGALDKGAHVRPEPWRRGADGKVLREGFLHLPSRHDLEIVKGGRSTRPGVDTQMEIGFDAIETPDSSGFSMAIFPFQWQSAELMLETRQRMPNWTPLRLWFLEFVQSSYGEEAPDLHGALHGIGNPHRSGGKITFKIDFGSAPLRCGPALIEALGQTGAARGSLREVSEVYCGRERSPPGGRCRAAEDAGFRSASRESGARFAFAGRDATTDT